MLYQGFIEIENYLGTLSRSVWTVTLKAHPLNRPTYLVVDHHYFFNGQQLQLLTTLIQQCQAVWDYLPLSQQAARSKAYDPLISSSSYLWTNAIVGPVLHLPVAGFWTIDQITRGYKLIS